MAAIDLMGQRFGRLVVVEYAGKRASGSNTLWRCRCECGTEIVARADHLRRKATGSCGCLQRQIARAQRFASITHGASHWPEFRVWWNIKRRCLNLNDAKFKDYGGRGIKVCERWIDSFENFILDVGRRPSPDLSIDRIENDGHYEPGNCRWATRKQQMNNTRRQDYALDVLGI